MADPPIDPVAPRPDPKLRFRAKRNNEHLKAFYGFMNALAAGVMITSLIAPSILGTTIASQVDQPGWVLIGVLLHAIGQTALGFGMRSED